MVLGKQLGQGVKARELEQRANEIMPGPHSNLRKPLSAYPYFILKGRDAHLWDVDGNEYIDFMCAAGPAILGYSNAEYAECLKDQIDTLYCLVSGGAQNPMELDLAGTFIRHVPCAEKVRFCLSGTEAVQLAIRLSRAYTGRQYFIRFEGHYHGWLDNVLGGLANNRTDGRPFAVESDQDSLYTQGRARGAFDESFLLPWNDAEVLARTLERYGKEVAMILMEPILCNGGCCPPRPGYLEKVRELCTEHGVVLCFDEVITGFRVGLGGAQAQLGVTPDIATFGKALAGGLPMGAVAGRKQIMDYLLDRRVIGAGTFNGYPLGVASSLVTLRILERDDGASYLKIDRLQKRLMDGLRQIMTSRGLPTLIQGPRGVFYHDFLDKDVAYSVRDLAGGDADKQGRFRTLMSEEGILLMWRGRWYVTPAHSDADVDRALEAAEKAVSRL